jgi:predicted RNA binding protein YcfA (HicA-like mRNA interferase family)
MGKADKLIEKAKLSPKNITFEELCLLFEHSGFVKRKGKGSHIVYKQTKAPCTMYTIQCGPNGKAMSYQVKWLLHWIESNVNGK